MHILVKENSNGTISWPLSSISDMIQSMPSGQSMCLKKNHDEFIKAWLNLHHIICPVKLTPINYRNNLMSTSKQSRKPLTTPSSKNIDFLATDDEIHDSFIYNKEYSAEISSSSIKWADEFLHLPKWTNFWWEYWMLHRKLDYSTCNFPLLPWFYCPFAFRYFQRKSTENGISALSVNSLWLQNGINLSEKSIDENCFRQANVGFLHINSSPIFLLLTNKSYNWFYHAIQFVV